MYILLNIQGVVKISDFGLARYADSPDCNLVGKATVFPIRWTAPEVFTENVLTKSSDVWSVFPAFATCPATWVKSIIRSILMHMVKFHHFEISLGTPCIHILIYFVVMVMSIQKHSGVMEYCATSLLPEVKRPMELSRTDKLNEVWVDLINFRI